MQQLSLKLMKFLQREIDTERFDEVVKGNPRVRTLADMIRRNGLLQAVVFLEGKAGDKQAGVSADGRLLALLWASLAQLDGSTTSIPDGLVDRLRQVDGWRSHLANASPVEILRQTELAMVSATWIARLADATKLGG